MKNIAILALAGAACILASCTQQQQVQDETPITPTIPAKGK